MSETPRPVRAWAEFDEWSVFVWFVDGKWGFSYHPKGRANGPANYWGVATLGEAVFCVSGDQPLRSLRILLSTGHWVELVRKVDAVTIAQGRKAVMLDPGCMKFLLFASDGVWLHGGWYMPEVPDTDAVTRALAEAVAWIQEQEEVTP